MAAGGGGAGGGGMSTALPSFGAVSCTFHVPRNIRRYDNVNNRWKLLRVEINQDKKKLASTIRGWHRSGGMPSRLITVNYNGF